MEAQPRTSGSTEITHLHLTSGFWCNNDEQTHGNCADFEVRFCCPNAKELKCSKDGYEWTVWLDSDDPVDSGDWENKDSFPAYVVCSNPTAIEAQVKSGSSGSTSVTHFNNNQGFWCINDEQPKDATCADFEVRFCCPEEYVDPCEKYNLDCADGAHEVYEIYNGTAKCSCSCGADSYLDIGEAEGTGTIKNLSDYRFSSYITSILSVNVHC